MAERVPNTELAKLFLKLGCTGFGGPAAHIAMMHQEVVIKRTWLTEQQFLDLVGATNLIPGPNSTELAIHIGREKGGLLGLIISGLCFILPAVFITLIFAFLYKAYGTLPSVQPFIYGIKPAIIAIVLGAIFPLAKKSIKTFQLALLGLLVLTLSLLHISEIYLLFGAGFLFLFYSSITSKNAANTHSFLSFLFFNMPLKLTIAVTNANLFWIFLKVGAILYGSGYVLFAFLDTELVATGLLSRQQLIDAIAVGQFTPGPVFTAVTFVGYQINGLSGAIISTIAIFLPSFVFVAMLNPLVKIMRRSPSFSAFLDAVNVASVAIIVSICYTMGKESISDWRTIVIAILSGLVVFQFKNINSAWIVLGGSTLGYLIHFF